MANPWFRMYSEFATDPKVQMLSEALQRRLLMVMCMRCSNTLVTLQEEEIAFQLRITEEELAQTKVTFVSKGFIDKSWNVLNWEKRQFSSDSSNARVAKHRLLQKEKQSTPGNVDVTLPKRNANGLEQNRTDTEQIEPKGSLSTSPAASADPELVNSGKTKTELPDCPYTRLLDLWSKRLPHLSQPRIWEGTRKTTMRQRWIQAAKPSAYSPEGYTTEAAGIAWWDSFFAYIANDTSLSSGFESNGRVWVPDLEWVMKTANFQKIIDGKYTK